MCDWEGCTTATNELPNPNQLSVVKTSGFLHPYIYRYPRGFPGTDSWQLEGEGITWRGQPSRQGIALFSVRTEFWRRVRQSVWRGSVQNPKTDNAVREIDLPSSLAAFLKASVGGRTSGFLFQTESGRPLTHRNVLRDGLGKIRRDMKLEDGKAFHSFRRFRTAHLRKNRMPWDLQKLWLGHANKDVTDRYAEQLKEDVEWRKQEAERAGLGFKLPIIESSVGLLGLPKQQKSKLKKVA
jgi:hypothetical protein